MAIAFFKKLTQELVPTLSWPHTVSKETCKRDVLPNNKMHFKSDRIISTSYQKIFVEDRE